MARLDQIIEIVTKAGKVVLDYYYQDYDVWEKKNQTPLTEADLASNKVIIDALKDFGVGILSEEVRDDFLRLEEEEVFIVDPIDGTKDFIKKTGDFAVMVGLTKKGLPVMGAIYQPTEDVVYYAQEGQGAYVKKGSQSALSIEVSEKTDFSEITMFGSRFHPSEAEQRFTDNLKIPKIIGKGSALKSCFIAEGKADFHFNPSDKTWEWDVCAADIILTEAGGKMTDIKGNDFVYNKKNPRNELGYMVSNGKIHKRALEELGKILR